MIFDWRPAARGDLRRIPLDQARDILRALDRYGSSRVGDVARLTEARFEGILRLRIGDWRAFFTHNSDGSITVVRVLHRSEAYR